MKTWPKPKPSTKSDRGERRFDSSSLREGGVHGKYVHRDYFAHTARWSFAVRFVRQGMRVLDVGCGRDVMMPKVLLHTLTTVPELYVGVDVDRIPKKPGIAWTRVLDEFDFTSRWKELLSAEEHAVDDSMKDPLGPFDLVTSFECLEHMKKPDGLKLLAGIRGTMKPDGLAILSTPVYNGKAMASAHLHEWLYDELEEALVESKFKIERVFGTFMTANAFKKVAAPEHRKLATELSAWLPWEVLSNMFAPLYPKVASNCAWLLRK